MSRLVNVMHYFVNEIVAYDVKKRVYFTNRVIMSGSTKSTRKPLTPMNFSSRLAGKKSGRCRGAAVDLPG